VGTSERIPTNRSEKALKPPGDAGRGSHSRLLEAMVEAYNTVAGPVGMYVLPSSMEVKVVEGDNRSFTVICGSVISDTEIEALISDYLAGDLGKVRGLLVFQEALCCRAYLGSVVFWRGGPRRNVRQVAGMKA
jgi:hypothetical protein